MWRSSRWNRSREDLELLADRRVPLVITYGVYEQGTRSPDVPAFFKEKCVEVMARYLETIAMAREVGVRIAVGTDTVHQDLAAELRALQKAGYRASEALQACTGWAADALRLPLVGRVQAGKVADLVAVEGDPLEDVEAVGRVRGVMQGGSASPMPDVMYVSLQGDDKILRFAMNPTTGELETLGAVAVPGGPAPMAVDPTRRFLHVARRGECKLSSFRIDQRIGDLELIGTVSLPTDPCYISMDRKGRFVLSAYYEGRGVAVHPIGRDGAVADPPAERRETARGAHCFQTDPSNRFAFVPHIAGRGPNEIWQFRFDEATGHLTPNAPAKVIPEGEVGPRHYCFHPHRDVVYFSNEQGCSVTAYRFDPSAGTLTAMQTVSTLPEGYEGRNSCAQIRMTPSGRFLYAPNRGHNSIACFAVDASTGHLTPTGHASAEPVPRAFNLDTDGKFLYAAGLETGRLTAFRIDADTGTLTPFETYPVGTRPMWVLTVRLAA